VTHRNSGRRIGIWSLAYMTLVTFACFAVMRFVPRHFRKKEPEE
jgi:hypothetical protein